MAEFKKGEKGKSCPFVSSQVRESTVDRRDRGLPFNGSQRGGCAVVMKRWFVKKLV